MAYIEPNHTNGIEPSSTNRSMNKTPDNSVKNYRKWLYLILVATFSATPVHAGQIYQCGNLFQDRPCAGNASNVVGQYDQSENKDNAVRNQQIKEEQRKQLDADIQKRYDAEVEAANRAQEANSSDLKKSAAIREHRVLEGMSKKETIKSWGDPDRKKQVTTKYGYREEWTYVRDWGNKEYVYFDGDTVSEVSLVDSHID